jgi:hypothetical protein
MAKTVDDPEMVASTFLNEISDRWALRFRSDEEKSEFLRSTYTTEAEWEHLNKYRQSNEEKRRQRQLDQWAERVGQGRADETAENFVKGHFPGATAGEKQFILAQIAKEMKVPEGTYDFSLSEMLSGGLPGVRSRYRRRHLKHLKHTWGAVKALVALAAILLIYGKLESNFEIIACSLLILLLTRARRWHEGGSLSNASYNQAGYIRFVELKKTLGAEPSPDEYRALWELEKDVKKGIVRHYVVDTGNTLINLVVYWQLLRVCIG